MSTNGYLTPSHTCVSNRITSEQLTGNSAITWLIGDYRSLTDGRDGGDDLPELQLVQDRRLSRGVQTD